MYTENRVSIILLSRFLQLMQIAKNTMDRKLTSVEEEDNDEREDDEDYDIAHLRRNLNLATTRIRRTRETQDISYVP